MLVMHEQLFARAQAELTKLKLGSPFVEAVVRQVVEMEAARMGIGDLDPVNVTIEKLMPWANEKAIRDRPVPKPGGG